MRVAFHTLGCKVNQYETEAIKEAFVSRGADAVGEDEFADVYIINTCTVTNIADRKSRQFIRRAKKTNPDALIVVTGCYAQVAADEVAAMPEVDLVIGNRLKSEICGLVLELIASHGVDGSHIEDDTAAVRVHGSDRRGLEPGCQHNSIQVKYRKGQMRILHKLAAGNAYVKVLPRNELTYYEDMGRIEGGADGMSRAYIKIQDGCDRFCSYCLIPYARGPVRSRPAADIIEEVKALTAKGYREIVLTGINTALYGTEDGADCSLSELLTRIDELELPASAVQEKNPGDSPQGLIAASSNASSQADFRIRLSSLEPTVVDKDNVEKIIRHKRLCRHLHLSVQAGSDNVLKAMNRRYTRSEYLDIVEAIREYDPLFGITTDIIVGFPGEAEEDFEDSLAIVGEAGFGRTHVFRYSPRKGTAGAKLPRAVPEKEKKQRSARLEHAGDEAAAAFIKANLGITHTVLIEEINDGYAEGYTGNYIKVYIRTDKRKVKDPKTAQKNEQNLDTSSDDALQSHGSSGLTGGGHLTPGALIEVTLTEPFRDGALSYIAGWTR